MALIESEGAAMYIIGAGSSEAEIRFIQEGFHRLGGTYPEIIGAVDGKHSSKFDAAVAAFQKVAGAPLLPQTGLMDPLTQLYFVQALDRKLPVPSHAHEASGAHAHPELAAASHGAHMSEEKVLEIIRVKLGCKS